MHDAARPRGRAPARTASARSTGRARPTARAAGRRPGSQLLVVGGVEEVQLHRHREGERGDGQELARHPQGRQPEDEGDDAAGHGRERRGTTNRSTLRSAMRLAVTTRADAHDRHLAEADHAAPAGQHDERQRDEAVGEGERAEVDLRVGPEHRQQPARATDQRPGQHELGGPDLGQPRRSAFGSPWPTPTTDHDDSPELGPVRPTAAAAAARRRSPPAARPTWARRCRRSTARAGRARRGTTPATNAPDSDRMPDDDGGGQRRQQHRRAGDGRRGGRPRSAPAGRRSAPPGRRRSTTAAARAG